MVVCWAPARPTHRYLNVCPRGEIDQPYQKRITGSFPLHFPHLLHGLGSLVLGRHGRLPLFDQHPLFAGKCGH